VIPAAATPAAAAASIARGAPGRFPRARSANTRLTIPVIGLHLPAQEREPLLLFFRPDARDPPPLPFDDDRDPLEDDLERPDVDARERPEEAAFERLPDARLPEERLPEERLPEERLPEERPPDEPLPEELRPDDLRPDELRPDERLRLEPELDAADLLLTSPSSIWPRHAPLSSSSMRTCALKRARSARTARLT
jgi:hypothetical protein